MFTSNIQHLSVLLKNRSSRPSRCAHPLFLFKAGELSSYEYVLTLVSIRKGQPVLGERLRIDDVAAQEYHSWWGYVDTWSSFDVSKRANGCRAQAIDVGTFIGLKNLHTFNEVREVSIRWSPCRLSPKVKLTEQADKADTSSGSNTCLREGQLGRRDIQQPFKETPAHAIP